MGITMTKAKPLAEARKRRKRREGSLPVIHEYTVDPHTHRSTTGDFGFHRNENLHTLQQVRVWYFSNSLGFTCLCIKLVMKLEHHTFSYIWTLLNDRSAINLKMLLFSFVCLFSHEGDLLFSVTCDPWYNCCLSLLLLLCFSMVVVLQCLTSTVHPPFLDQTHR